MENYLKQRRKELGLTMKAVAEAVGVSEGTVSRWESGAIANMRRDRIYSLAKILCVSPNFIMTGYDDKQTNALINIRPITKEEQEHLYKYRGLDDYGRDLVDIITNKEWDRVCKDYLIPNAAHNDKGEDPEEQKLTHKDIDILNKIK